MMFRLRHSLLPEPGSAEMRRPRPGWLRRHELTKERKDHPNAPPALRLRYEPKPGPAASPFGLPPLPRGSGFDRPLPHGGNHVDESGRGHLGHRGQGRRVDLREGGGLELEKRKAKERPTPGTSFAASFSSSGRNHLSRQHPGQLPTPPTFNPREINSWLIDWGLSALARSPRLTLSHAPSGAPRGL